MLVYTFAHPAILVASHSVVLANLRKLHTVVYKNKLLCNACNLACVVAIAINTVANIIAHFIFYHCLLLFVYYTNSICYFGHLVN